MRFDRVYLFKLSETYCENSRKRGKRFFAFPVLSHAIRLEDSIYFGFERRDSVDFFGTVAHPRATVSRVRYDF